MSMVIYSQFQEFFLLYLFVLELFSHRCVCIAGVDNPGHPYIMTVGMVAGDEDSYTEFADLFDPVIDGRHNGYAKVGLPMLI